MKINYYGLEPKLFPPGTTQLHLELLMCKAKHPETFGGLSAIQHRKNVAAMLWPWAYKNWNDWTELCLWAWCNYEEIGMTGPAASGKTFTFTMLAMMEFLCNPDATRVALTSTTIPSLRNRIWSEVMRFMKPLIPMMGFNAVDSATKIQFQKGDDKHAIQALAVDSGKVEEAVGKLQGVHPDRMIIMVDEAAQTAPAVFSARSNLRVGTSFYRFVAIANASSQFDSHGQFCKPKNGWGSITVNDEQWETQTGVCLHFDGLKSPNVKAGKIVVPHLFDMNAIEATRKSHGEGSLEWWSYVRGFWPPSNARNTILDAATIQEGKAEDTVLWKGGGIETIAGLDPAFTSGGDDCMIRIGKVGIDANGNQILLSVKREKIFLEERTDYPLFYQVADKTISILMEHNIRPENFGMDTTGAGAGVADIISQRWKNGFHRISFAGAASDEIVSVEDDRPGNKVYGNRVSQLWGQVARLIQMGKIRGLDNDTAQQLCTRVYSLKNERVVVESKADMKKRTNGQSPDAADAFAVMCEVFIRNNGMHGGANTISGNRELDDFFEQNQILENYS